MVIISRQTRPSNHRTVHLSYLISNSVKQQQPQHMTMQREAGSAFPPPCGSQRDAGPPGDRQNNETPSTSKGQGPGARERRWGHRNARPTKRSVAGERDRRGGSYDAGRRGPKERTGRLPGAYPTPRSALFNSAHELKKRMAVHYRDQVSQMWRNRENKI